MGGPTIKEIEQDHERAMKQMILQLSEMKNTARGLNMWQTFRLLDKTQEKAGWEMAEFCAKREDSRHGE